MIFSRKLILVAGAALLAACGDKVIIPPAVTPPVAVTKINSVDVSPLTATINAGQSITFTAAVNADAGVTYTTAWTSSVSSVTVSSAGVVTTTATSATPGASICATATAGTQVVKGCGTLVVSPVSPILPATVSIQSITMGNFNIPVNPLNVFGQMDVTLNVNPGNQTISKVETLVGGVVACTQTFTAAQAAALRFSADEAVAAQTTFPQIVCSVNTAAFNATTGIPTWMNGSQAVQAKVYTTTSGTGTAATASAVQTLTFNNANTFVASTSNSGTSAIGANGYKYSSGNIVASIIPVIYTSGVSFSAGTITFGAAGCDAFGPRTMTLAAGTAPAWTATFATATGTATATNFKSYELRTTNLACPLATGEGFTVTATDNNGNQLFAATVAANNTANLFRMDNVAPGAPTLIQNPGARQNGWVNAAIAFTTTNASSAANGMFVDGALDAGIGGYTRWARTAASTGGVVDAAIAATASSSPTLPAPSTAGTDYCLVISAKDALGNESARPAAGTACSAVAVGSNTALAARSTLFGVDIAPPTIAFSGGLASNGRLNGGAVGGEFQVTVLDTGSVGNSGMLSNAAVMGTASIRNASALSPVCFLGTVVSGVCTAVSVNAAPAFPLVPTTTIAAATTVGYYTYVAYSQDAAGNASGTITRVTAYDPAANVPALTTAIFTTPLTGPAATFNANASDNFDLRDVTYTLAYAGGLAAPIGYPAVVLNTYNVAPLVNTNVPAGITINGFMRQVEDINVACNGALGVSGAYKPNNLGGTVRDQVNNATGPVNTGILAGSVTTGTSYTVSPAPQLVRAFFVQAGVTGCPTAAQVNGAVLVSSGATSPATNVLSTTLNADVYGPTATFLAPFTRVDFYVLSGGVLNQIGSATSYTTVDDGSAFGRRHRYSFAWTPGTTFGNALVGVNIYAIGVNAAGDALVSALNANVSITNP